MAFKRSTKSADKAVSPQAWSVTELGAFYTTHRSEFLSHANRVLKDSAKAEEITQDALIKFMLAAPELESTDHALAYIHRTIENLCIDLFRMEGRRPNLVVIDDAQAEVEATYQVSGDHEAVISAAADAAIIRQALSLLSPAERAALVMWEVEGRSTAEIASELGIKESAVRHTVSRARASMRKILSTLIVDEKRGLTALDALSTTYKKAAEIAAKSSKAALSLILVVAAFLGFNTLTGREGVVTQDGSAVTMPSDKSTTDKSVTDNSNTNSTEDADISIELAAFQDQIKVVSSQISFLRQAVAVYNWAGLDASGTPVGFSSNLGSRITAGAQLIKFPNLSNESSSSIFKVSQNGVELLLSQDLFYVDGKLTATILPLFAPANTPAVITSSEQSVSTGSDGSKLIISSLKLANTGSDGQSPSAINVRIKVSADGLEILAQSAQILFSGSTQDEGVI
ncbi:MAG: RNA polymerase sigma factor [Candidatus Nanopelagicus sp.]